MISIILYGFSILFSPGVVTVVSVNKGLNKRFRKSIGFFLSIGVATYILLLFYAFTGERLIKKEYLSIISILGCSYMFYLSYKMFRHKVNIDESDTTEDNLGFKQGLFMQLFNPKASLAALPIATMQYPLHNITGTQIALFSIIFLVFGILSPALYCAMGQYFSRFIRNGNWLSTFNKVMATLLFVIASSIFYEMVILKLSEFQKFVS